MRILYNLSILAYSLLVHLTSPFNIKAKQWWEGRKDWQKRLSEKIRPGDKVVWIHCASLGEFEQGRPVIEEIRKLKPGVKIVLTFFSPSGYEIRKNYAFADYICYLPSDTRSNAAAFIKLLHPETAIFVKYEFWNNYISELKRNDIPLYLISGIFRRNQHFFKWYGAFFRQMLLKFEKIYVQDDNSLQLLNGIGIKNAEVTGDTRFDRVKQIAGAAKDIPQLGSFRGEEPMFLAGSSWKPDEEIISEYINRNPEKMKWVFAPHEIEEENIARLEKLFSVKSVRFSQYNGNQADARVLIIDNIGMLSSAYRYAYIAAVGGGFGKGIHNVLEPACWGIPVLFGPRHEKFREAVELINENGGMTFDSYEKFSSLLNKLLDDKVFYLKSAESAGLYVSKNTGATEKILGDLLTKI
jgi:3-deoxy-D-manno-octulosonic-acid transferase